MAKQYLYKIKHKYKKNPELLEQFGFRLFQDELCEEQLYAIPIVIPKTGSIFTYLKKALEKIYLNANSEERESDFKDFKFKEILTPKQKRAYELILTEAQEKELTECQLCFYNSGEGEWCLFINAPDNVQYYNVKVLDENVPNGIIPNLLKNDVIYKARNRLK